MLQNPFLPFVVTEDKIFLPKPVEELLQNQEFHKVPLMTGVTNDEFGWVLPNVSKSHSMYLFIYLFLQIYPIVN